MFSWTHICNDSSFPAGELWHAVQPHRGGEDLPEGIWRSESQIWKRRPGPSLLLCCRQDRTLPAAHTLWKGQYMHARTHTQMHTLSPSLSLHFKCSSAIPSVCMYQQMNIFLYCMYVSAALSCSVTSLWYQLLCGILCPGPADGEWGV